MLTVRALAVCGTTGAKMMIAADATAPVSLHTRGDSRQAARLIR
jgi:hypothetical protein